MSTKRLTYERHGYFGTRVYSIWADMIRRCHDPKRNNYERYGGRGITVCESWRNSFKAFLADMGEPPKGLSIERINNALGYYKENCRWATPHEQALNRKSNILMTIEGETKTLWEWAKAKNLKYSLVHWRKTQGGYSDEECLLPSKKKHLLLSYQGKNYTPKQIAELVSIRVACVYARIKKGWSAEEIITRPNSQPYKRPGWKFTPRPTVPVDQPNHGQP